MLTNTSIWKDQIFKKFEKVKVCKFSHLKKSAITFAQGCMLTSGVFFLTSLHACSAVISYGTCIIFQWLARGPYVLSCSVSLVRDWWWWYSHVGRRLHSYSWQFSLWWPRKSCQNLQDSLFTASQSNLDHCLIPRFGFLGCWALVLGSTIIVSWSAMPGAVLLDLPSPRWLVQYKSTTVCSWVGSHRIQVVGLQDFNESFTQGLPVTVWGYSVGFPFNRCHNCPRLSTQFPTHQCHPAFVRPISRSRTNTHLMTSSLRTRLAISFSTACPHSPHSQARRQS